MISEASTTARDVAFTDLIDLACEIVGGKTLLTNDDFFAPMENLLKVSAPVFIPDKYTEFGKWMDGWESRRKRNAPAGNDDWCVLKLGLPGRVVGVNVDTSFFVGNFPEYASLEACEAPRTIRPQELADHKSLWKEIIPKTRLKGGSHNLIAISDASRFTHVRLRIFPDGGVARLRVHGIVLPDWKALQKSRGSVDLACVENGGIVVTCNDSFFGQKDNLILPGRATTMGGGWETRRRRGPGHDWIVVKLGAPGRLSGVEVDTNHFKGNFPESCSLEGCYLPGPALLPCDFRDRDDIKWEEILPRTKLQAHHRHLFEKQLGSAVKRKPMNYIRLNIFPDGGISRLRVFGEMVP